MKFCLQESLVNTKIRTYLVIEISELSFAWTMASCQISSWLLLNFSFEDKTPAFVITYLSIRLSFCNTKRFQRFNIKALSRVPLKSNVILNLIRNTCVPVKGIKYVLLILIMKIQSTLYERASIRSHHLFHSSKIVNFETE